MKIQLKTLAPMLALAWTFAGTACVTEDEADDTENPEEIDAQDDGPIELEASAAGIQADCGRLTCTVRLNRANTKRAKSLGTLLDVVGSGCGLLPGGYAVACTAAIAVPGAVLSSSAGKYYDAGNCFGVRFNKFPVPPPAPSFVGVPREVKRGTYVCK